MANTIVKIIGSSINFLSLFSTKKASKIALNIFATPRKGKVTDSQYPILESTFKEEVTYNDISIMTYRWLGKNKTILLAHGWESNASRWKFLISELKKFDYNIIALDAPAHGNSSGKQFNALLYSECINKVVNHFKPEIIVGHSVGGMASVFFLNKYRYKNLQKLVLLGAPAHFSGVFKRYRDMLGYNNRVKEGLDSLVLERFNNLPDYFHAAKFSKNITTQGLIIHDEDDKIIPYKDALLYKEHYSNSTLHTTKGAGHSLANKNIANRIIEFINN